MQQKLSQHKICGIMAMDEQFIVSTCSFKVWKYLWQSGHFSFYSACFKIPEGRVGVRN